MVVFNEPVNVAAHVIFPWEFHTCRLLCEFYIQDTDVLWRTLAWEVENSNLDVSKCDRTSDIGGCASLSLYYSMKTNWFHQADFKIDTKIHSVPELAQWAKDNLHLVRLSISEIKKREIHALQLFQDADSEWIERSMSADLSFPILMLEHNNGEWEIIDGNHRTWKAWKTGEPLTAYVIPEDRLSQ